jgi:hypothetical protein
MPKQNSPMNMICKLAFVTAAAGMCSANNANAQYGPPDAPAPMTYSERAGHNAPGWITQSEADQRTSQGQIHCGAGGPTLADGRENPLSQRWMDRRICDAIMAVDDSPRASKSYRIQHCTTVLEQRKLPHGIDHLKFPFGERRIGEFGGKARDAPDRRAGAHMPAIHARTRLSKKFPKSRRNVEALGFTNRILAPRSVCARLYVVRPHQVFGAETAFAETARFIKVSALIQ